MNLLGEESPGRFCRIVIGFLVAVSYPSPSVSRLFRFLLWCACTIPACAQLRWEAREMEFHPTVADTNVVGRYVFRNMGDYPVQIDSVRTSCGCTTASLPKKLYAPAESGEITVTFDIGQRLGDQHKEIMVMTNDPRESMVLLKMNIHIPEVLLFNPAFVFWNQDEAAESKMINIQIGIATNVHVIAVESNNEKLKPELMEVVPGREYQIRVKPENTSEPVMATLVLRTDFPSEKPRSYNAFAAVRGATIQPTPSR